MFKSVFLIIRQQIVDITEEKEDESKDSQKRICENI